MIKRVCYYGRYMECTESTDNILDWGIFVCQKRKANWNYNCCTGSMENSVDTDQPAALDLHCSQKRIDISGFSWESINSLVRIQTLNVTVLNITLPYSRMSRRILVECNMIIVLLISSKHHYICRSLDSATPGLVILITPQQTIM